MSIISILPSHGAPRRSLGTNVIMWEEQKGGSRAAVVHLLLRKARGYCMHVFLVLFVLPTLAQTVKINRLYI